MKKIAWCLFTCFFSLCAHSQWTTSGTNIYNSNTGNVGIGTTSPATQLQINSTANEIISILASGGLRGGYYVRNSNSAGYADMILENDHGSFNNYASFAIGGSTNSYPQAFGLSKAERVWLLTDGTYNLGLCIGTVPSQPLVLGTNNLERMRVFGGGNVAIGTTSDNGNLLQVNGNLWTTGLKLPTGAAVGKVLTSDASGTATWQSPTGGSGSGWALNGNSAGTIESFGTADNNDLPVITNNIERMRITAGGNVAIGTTDPQGYMLAVNGSAIFTAAWVKPKLNWPDYVFQKDYRLPGLDSVSKFIQINKHLPDMPSAETVAKTGIDLGGNQTVLLKKVEELTLYLIDQDKTMQEYKQKIAGQQQQLDSQQRQLEDQQRRLERLEKMMNK